MRQLKLNPGAQEGFVKGDEKFSAYIGGLGSGKTWAGVARGIKFSLQPKPEGVFHAPHGLIAASSYQALDDIIIAKLQEIVDYTGLANWATDYKKSKKELTLRNGAVIRLRSLDNPDTIIRGPEYTWAFIDEGRNATLKDWKLVTGRLRQPGYTRGAWVASTPNGFDWMYHVFHPDGDHHATEYPDANWYNAAMRENIHLDADYLDMMEQSYSGRFYDQEVLGQFVGIVEGGVFPEWDPEKYCVPLGFRPDLPLYSFWDFGIGDPGVCIFAQVEWRVVQAPTPGAKPVKMPWLYILGAIEARDWPASAWAEAYHGYIAEHFPPGTATRGDYGDPAGMNRAPGSGTSVISDLNAARVPVAPVPKKPQDYAIRILTNMIAGGRVLVNKTEAQRVSDALSSHKWKLDKNSVRTGEHPVHDWTSHLVDAIRYGATVLLPFNPRDLDAPDDTEGFAPTTYGHVFEQLMNKPQTRWLGGGGAKKRPTFIPTITPRS
jgi:hypothetical protein